MMSTDELRRKLEAKRAELRALDETLSGLWFKREELFQEIEALEEALEKALEKEFQQRRQRNGEDKPNL
jgi:predicted  nucleic acid-binding Zn-ribbon protein